MNLRTKFYNLSDFLNIMLRFGIKLLQMYFKSKTIDANQLKLGLGGNFWMVSANKSYTAFTMFSPYILRKKQGLVGFIQHRGKNFTNFLFFFRDIFAISYSFIKTVLKNLKPYITFIGFFILYFFVFYFLLQALYRYNVYINESYNAYVVLWQQYLDDLNNLLISDKNNVYTTDASFYYNKTETNTFFDHLLFSLNLTSEIPLRFPIYSSEVNLLKNLGLFEWDSKKKKLVLPGQLDVEQKITQLKENNADSLVWKFNRGDIFVKNRETFEPLDHKKVKPESLAFQFFSFKDYATNSKHPFFKSNAFISNAFGDKLHDLIGEALLVYSPEEIPKVPSVDQYLKSLQMIFNMTPVPFTRIDSDFTLFYKKFLTHPECVWEFRNTLGIAPYLNIYNENTVKLLFDKNHYSSSSGMFGKQLYYKLSKRSSLRDTTMGNVRHGRSMFVRAFSKAAKKKKYLEKFVGDPRFFTNFSKLHLLFPTEQGDFRFVSRFWRHTAKGLRIYETKPTLKPKQFLKRHLKYWTIEKGQFKQFKERVGAEQRAHFHDEKGRGKHPLYFYSNLWTLRSSRGQLQGMFKLWRPAQDANHFLGDLKRKYFKSPRKIPKNIRITLIRDFSNPRYVKSDLKRLSKLEFRKLFDHEEFAGRSNPFWGRLGGYALAFEFQKAIRIDQDEIWTERFQQRVIRYGRRHRFRGPRVVRRVNRAMNHIWLSRRKSIDRNLFFNIMFMRDTAEAPSPLTRVVRSRVNMHSPWTNVSTYATVGGRSLMPFTTYHPLQNTPKRIFLANLNLKDFFDHNFYWNNNTFTARKLPADIRKLDVNLRLLADKFNYNDEFKNQCYSCFRTQDFYRYSNFLKKKRIIFNLNTIKPLNFKDQFTLKTTLSNLVFGAPVQQDTFGKSKHHLSILFERLSKEKLPRQWLFDKKLRLQFDKYDFRKADRTYYRRDLHAAANKYKRGLAGKGWKMDRRKVYGYDLLTSWIEKNERYSISFNKKLNRLRTNFFSRGLSASPTSVDSRLRGPNALWAKDLLKVWWTEQRVVKKKTVNEAKKTLSEFKSLIEHVDPKLRGLRPNHGTSGTLDDKNYKLPANFAEFINRIPNIRNAHAIFSRGSGAFLNTTSLEDVIYGKTKVSFVFWEILQKNLVNQIAGSKFGIHGLAVNPRIEQLSLQFGKSLELDFNTLLTKIVERHKKPLLNVDEVYLACREIIKKEKLPARWLLRMGKLYLEWIDYSAPLSRRYFYWFNYNLTKEHLDAIAAVFNVRSKKHIMNLVFEEKLIKYFKDPRVRKEFVLGFKINEMYLRQLKLIFYWENFTKGRNAHVFFNLANEDHIVRNFEDFNYTYNYTKKQKMRDVQFQNNTSFELKMPPIKSTVFGGSWDPHSYNNIVIPYNRMLSLTKFYTHLFKELVFLEREHVKTKLANPSFIKQDIFLDVLRTFINVYWFGYGRQKLEIGDYEYFLTTISFLESRPYFHIQKHFDNIKTYLNHFHSLFETWQFLRLKVQTAHINTEFHQKKLYEWELNVMKRYSTIFMQLQTNLKDFYNLRRMQIFYPFGATYLYNSNSTYFAELQLIYHKPRNNTYFSALTFKKNNVFTSSSLLYDLYSAFCLKMYTFIFIYPWFFFNVGIEYSKDFLNYLKKFNFVWVDPLPRWNLPAVELISIVNDKINDKFFIRMFNLYEPLIKESLRYRISFFPEFEFPPIWLINKVVLLIKTNYAGPSRIGILDGLCNQYKIFYTPSIKTEAAQTNQNAFESYLQIDKTAIQVPIGTEIFENLHGMEHYSGFKLAHFFVQMQTFENVTAELLDISPVKKGFWDKDLPLTTDEKVLPLKHRVCQRVINLLYLDVIPFTKWYTFFEKWLFAYAQTK